MLKVASNLVHGGSFLQTRTLWEVGNVTERACFARSKGCPFVGEMYDGARENLVYLATNYTSLTNFLCHLVQFKSEQRRSRNQTGGASMTKSSEVTARKIARTLSCLFVKRNVFLAALKLFCVLLRKFIP